MSDYETMSVADMLRPESAEIRLANCPKHGEYESRCIYAKIWSKCPACEREAKEAEEALELKRKAESAKRRWQQMMGSACIPERFQDRSLASYAAQTAGQQHALTFSNEFAGSFTDGNGGRSAIFSGGVGTGKTHLAVGIALHVMDRYGKSAVFVTVQRLIRSVRDAWRRDSELSETEVIERFASPALLILDEVGVQAGSENERQILFDVLNERYEKRRSTLLLTNLNVDECRHFLGERVFDRMREDGGEFVVFDWASHRGRK